MKNSSLPTALILSEEQMIGSFSNSVRHFLNNGYIFDGPANDYSNMTSHCVLRGISPETRNTFILVELDRPCFYSGPDDEPSARTLGIYKYVGKKHWNSVDRRHPTETLREETFYAIGSREEKGAWTADKEFAQRCKNLRIKRHSNRHVSGRRNLDLTNKKVAELVLAVARKAPKMKSLQKKNITKAYWTRTGIDNDGSLVLNFDINRNGDTHWNDAHVTTKTPRRWGDLSPKFVAKATKYYAGNCSTLMLNGSPVPVTKENVIKKLIANRGWN